jgi:uncharacterized membrane protein YozB (DUF420 family)
MDTRRVILTALALVVTFLLLLAWMLATALSTRYGIPASVADGLFVLASGSLAGALVLVVRYWRC